MVPFRFVAQHSSSSTGLARRDSIISRPVSFKIGSKLGKPQKFFFSSVLNFFPFVYSEHGNKHRQPHNALSVRDEERVVGFIDNYVEEHGILLPGRIPGYNRTDLKLLPSSITKLAMFESYSQLVAAGPSGRVPKYQTFINIWQKYRPQVIITKPMSDLCFTCQQNNTLILRSANKWEEEKSMVTIILLNYVYVYPTCTARYFMLDTLRI